ncbi:Uncharacterised protein [Morganella morganii]|nr:Uncharacterised protein [Morganella morganii]
MLSSFWSEFVLIFNTNPRLITLVWTACWAITSFGLGVWAGHYLAKKTGQKEGVQSYFRSHGTDAQKEPQAIQDRKY